MIDNRRPVVNVTPSGEFWRILLPGTYTLKVKNMKEKFLKNNKIKFLGILSRLFNLSSTDIN